MNNLKGLSTEEAKRKLEENGKNCLPTSELFHAIGMRDTETSIFKFHWFDNKMMIIAFVVGFIGQIFVTEVPFLVKAFGTVSLSFMEWIIIILVCLTPLVVHELWCIKNKIFNKK